jgi:hypothetical protein
LEVMGSKIVNKAPFIFLDPPVSSSRNRTDLQAY